MTQRPHWIRRRLAVLAWWLVELLRPLSNRASLALVVVAERVDVKEPCPVCGALHDSAMLDLGKWRLCLECAGSGRLLSPSASVPQPRQR